ncbi:hypothetical protein BABINDRAFT_160364 [Babjeviella inositovora NRRL Y-12698]|uniref:Uncharacterized protein n=1 Tax=Babjeviella inositovora NRRL Y-12698 TaxID=984486 RepID=A0A1E3QTE1_9ASCO|nr:uncharacterized protein BABINDRAFT_160364 [Babjeviella inositovora NRRL Y-12698]ODQ80928.1 hypothetical protein BABINDRAFT_160364 [Babjeviella inositovora NRRL Y-12698]
MVFVDCSSWWQFSPSKKKAYIVRQTPGNGLVFQNGMLKRKPMDEPGVNPEIFHMLSEHATNYATCPIITVVGVPASVGASVRGSFIIPSAPILVYLYR